MQHGNQNGEAVPPGRAAPEPGPAAAGPGSGTSGTPFAAGSTGMSIGSIDTYTVANIREDAMDVRGARIRRVYFKRETYAVYTSGEHVHVQYADDRAAADRQIANVAKLVPLRDRLAYLIHALKLGRTSEGWDCYRLELAEALRLGLEGQMEAAQSTLQAALGDAQERVARLGRIAYLRYAVLIASLLSVGLLMAASHSPGGDPVPLVLFGTAAGAIGALFSIALGIRARTVTVDADWRTNAYDGVIRVGIGAIAGGMLFLLLTSGIVSLPWLSSPEAPPAWQMAAIVGFAGGFLERLVPDILEKGRPADAAAKSAGDLGA